jgi:hypothetical protein
MAAGFAARGWIGWTVVAESSALAGPPHRERRYAGQFDVSALICRVRSDGLTSHSSSSRSRP